MYVIYCKFTHNLPGFDEFKCSILSLSQTGEYLEVTDGFLQVIKFLSLAEQER